MSTVQVPVLFRTLGYSGMFVMAGVFALLGVIVSILVPGNIQYEREDKRKGDFKL